MDILELKFRFAKESDLEKVIMLCNSCFDENTNIENAIKVFQKTKNDSNHLYLIGEMNGEIVAHTKITIIPTMFEEMGTYAVLNHVCVHPDYRRHHVADHMMRVIKKVCQEKHCSSIKLWSCNFRIPAHKLYYKEGYEKMDASFFTLELEK